MRVCMVTRFYPPYHFGGDAIFVRALAKALGRHGHDVEVVHCEDAYRLAAASAPTEPAANDGIVVHRRKSRVGLLLDREFDVVNFHNISLIGGPAVLGMSKALVNLYTLHEHWTSAKRKGLRLSL